MQRSPVLYAELVHKASNLDEFLTAIGYLPVIQQNKLLQEKIVLLNDKVSKCFDLMKQMTMMLQELGPNKKISQLIEEF